MSFALRKLKNLKKKVDHLNQALDSSKNEISDILKEMKTEFNSAGIVLEQYVHIVEPQATPFCPPPTEASVTASEPAKVGSPPVTAAASPDQEATPVESAPVDDERSNLTALVPSEDEVMMSPDGTEDETLVTKEMVTDVQSAPHQSVEKDVVRNLEEKPEGKPPAPQDDTDTLNDDGVSQVDESPLEPSTVLSYGDKDEVDFMYDLESVHNSESQEVEPTDLATSNEASFSTTGDVNAAPVPGSEPSPEIGRVIGMIANKATYVHTGMKVTTRPHRASDEIGLQVVV